MLLEEMGLDGYMAVFEVGYEGIDVGFGSSSSSSRITMSLLLIGVTSREPDDVDFDISVALAIVSSISLIRCRKLLLYAH